MVELNATVPLILALNVWVYSTLEPGIPDCVPSVVKLFTTVLPTGRLNAALLLALFTAGSLPPAMLAVLIMLGAAFDSTCTLIVMGLPEPPALMTLDDVQVTTCPLGVHIQPVPPEPSAT